jgi:predicted DNA-binding transcriptional regulator AlpA
MLCYHCRQHQAETVLGLCVRCDSVESIKVLYLPRRGRNHPGWAEHLERLADRVRLKLPLFSTSNVPEEGVPIDEPDDEEPVQSDRRRAGPSRAADCGRRGRNAVDQHAHSVADGGGWEGAAADPLEPKVHTLAPCRRRGVSGEPAELLTPQAVADVLGVCLRTVWVRLRAGQLPEPVRLGRSVVRWRRADVERLLH